MFNYWKLNFPMAIGNETVSCMYRLPKMMVLVLMLQMKQLALGTNIGNVHIIVLTKNWIRIKIYRNLRAKCFIFGKVTIG